MPPQVWFAAELNLVQASRLDPELPNMINSVVPFVALDMISYSSYDTQVRCARAARAPVRSMSCVLVCSYPLKTLRRRRRT